MQRQFKKTAFALTTLTLMMSGVGGIKANEFTSVFNVNSTVDELDSNLGDGICKTISNKCTLRAAIQQANTTLEKDTINLPSGTYNLTIEETIDQGALAGDLDIINDTLIIGSGKDSTVIDGKGIDRVFDSFLKSELRNLTIRGGSVMVNEEDTFDGGAGIRVTGTLILDNVVVKDNTLVTPTATDISGDRGYGAGIFGEYAGIKINNSTIENNSGSFGAGIALVSGSEKSEITNTTISNNSANRGGGIYKDTYSGELLIQNTTISGNTTKTSFGSGSAFYIASISGTSIKNSTITNNKNLASSNESLTGNNSLNISTSIISKNLKSDGIEYNCYESSNIISGGYNLISDNSCSAFKSTGDIKGVDPRLGVLANNGGNTKTHALLAGSPAIDASTNTGCPAQDQRGSARPYNGQCDIGAYEANVASAFVPLYRFWSLQKQGHFYTANAAERDSIIANDPSWSYEDVAYKIVKANSSNNCDGTGKSAVYRFWNATVQHHFYTINAAEKDDLIANNSAWAYEGVGFCADKKQLDGYKPVYRFYSSTKGGHFYTINEAEKDSLIANDPSWSYEDIAYYARP